MAQDAALLLEALSETADEYIEPEKSYTLVYVVGEPGRYNDRVPDDWEGVGGKAVDTVGEYDVVRFNPRNAHAEGDTLVLEDGTIGMYPEYKDEYEDHVEHRIAPDDYVVALVVNHHPRAPDSGHPDRVESEYRGRLPLPKV